MPDAVALSQMGATFAERKAAREKVSAKKVQADDTEDKAISAPPESKSSRKKK